MAKIIPERDIRKMHRDGKLDMFKLKAIEPKKPELPPKPTPEIEAMNKTLNQLMEIFRTSKDLSDRNDRISELLAERINALENKKQEIKPMETKPIITGLKVIKRDSKDFIQNIEFVYDTNTRGIN